MNRISYSFSGIGIFWWRLHFMQILSRPRVSPDLSQSNSQRIGILEGHNPIDWLISILNVYRLLRLRLGYHLCSADNRCLIDD